ncbi:hypothetical protein COV83_06595, partial [Candidatus Peregrinibacteria bacterium CG11_big_fil_rev_8_21_14_0_20_49_14]
MEHVHTFLFSKLWSSKEHRLMFATPPETPGETEPTEEEASPEEGAEGQVGTLEALLKGMSPDQLRALREAIDAQLKKGEEAEEEEEEPIVEEEDEEEEEEEVPEEEESLASQTLDVVVGDSALALAGALETGDIEGSEAERATLEATLNEMVMNGEVNAGEINAWLEDAFPTFEVSYDAATMILSIPAESFDVPVVEVPVEDVPADAEKSPELNDTMREILESLAGPELDQVLRLDEMLDASDSASQEAMKQALAELAQELGPQIDNGNITEAEVNLWLAEAFEGQEILQYDHETGTFSVLDAQPAPAEDPVDVEPPPVVEVSPEELDAAKKAISEEIAENLVPIAANMAVDPIDESSVQAINEGLADLTDEFGVVPDDQEADLLKPLQDALAQKGQKVEKGADGV